MNITTILFEAHSGWRYLVILVLVVALIKFLIGMLGKQQWSGFDRALGSATSIVIGIQWLLGIVLWVLAPAAWFLSRGSVNFAEHAGTMTLAVVAAQIASGRAKRSPSDSAKFRISFIGTLIAGLLVALGVARITGMI